MKIAIFSDTFPPQVNGVANVVANSAFDLAKLGHEVRVFTVTKASEEKIGQITQAKYRVTALPSLPFPLYPGLRVTASLGWASRELKAWQPDIIHSHTPFALGWEAVRAAKKLQVPLVGTHHTFFDHYLKHVHLDFPLVRNWSWRYTVRYYEQCRAVIALSQSLADELTAHGLNRPIIRLNNPIDTALFARPTPRQKKQLKSQLNLPGITFVYMGRLSYEKDINRLIEAFATVYRQLPQTRLVIIGDGPERAQLAKQANQTAARPAISFTGFLFGDELVQNLQASDVFVTASQTENMPLSLLEAMAVGLPAVAVAAKGIPEIMTDGQQGYLVAPNHAGLFAQRMLDAARQNIDQLSDNARRTAEQYDRMKVTKDLETIYQNLIHKKYAIL